MKKIILLLFGIILLNMLIPINALAVANPDTLTIKRVNVYRSVIEEHDQLYLIHFDIAYSGTTPSQQTDETFICRLRASDGSQIGNSSTPYPYYNDGYSEGFIGLYFSYEDVVDLGMGWGVGTNYYITIDGNPLVAWDSGQPSTSIFNFATWFDEGSISDSQDELTMRLRYLITKIESVWNLNLIEGASGESYLTYYGEEYATHAIENLRAMAPDIFSASIKVPEFEEKDFTGDMYVSGDDKAYQVHGTNFYAQSFTMSKNYNIQAFKFKGFQTGSPTALGVSLYEATSGGTPTGASLAELVAQPDSITTNTSGDWIDGVFDTLEYGNAGSTYAIVFSCTGCDANNRYNVRADESNGYTGGLASVTNNSGTTWNTVDSGSDDIVFVILASDAFDRSYQERMEGRAVGTFLDFTNVADTFDMSRLWFSSIIWLIVSIALAYKVSKNSSPRYTIMVILLMQPIGALLGLVGWQWAIVSSAFIPAMLAINNFAFRRT